MKISSTESELFRLAYKQAEKSFHEGGLPIGAVLADGGSLISEGHNCRVQTDDPTAHGEIVCIRNAGRRARYNTLTLYTTLSPCMMCAGTILQFGIPRVIVGEDKNFPGNINFLQSHGVEVVLMDDEDCIALMRHFIAGNPELWDEDIAGREHV